MPKNKSWFNFENKAGEDSTAFIYGDIGMWGITAADFVNELSAVKSKVLNVRIDSDGGDVFAGIAIHNALVRHPATVNTYIDGLAASIASVIAMAGTERRIAKNAFIMVHEASTPIYGNKAELRARAALLEDIDKNSLVKTYQDATGLSEKELMKMMADTTWMSAEAALEKGFVTAIGEPVVVNAKFDLSKFGDVPQAVSAMNIITKPENERDLEAILRDSGLSRKDALTAVASLKAEALRDSGAEDVQKMKEFLQATLLKSVLQ